MHEKWHVQNNQATTSPLKGQQTIVFITYYMHSTWAHNIPPQKKKKKKNYNKNK